MILGSHHQWMLKPLGAWLMRNRIFTDLKYLYRENINYKVKMLKINGETSLYQI